jgi:DNA-binding XRE family transcriptional regulator
MVTDNPNRAGKSLLRQFRERHQLTQFQLRRLIGVSERRLSDWETGKARPNLENAVALARVYQVPLKVICQCCGVDVTGVPDDLAPQPQGEPLPSTPTPTH